MPGLEILIEITDQPAQGDAGTLLAGLIAGNEPFLGLADFRPLAVLARAAGALDGGLVGETARGFLYIELFWVTPARRGAGLGARLLAAAEREALARGCHAAWLATYDFQARAFYERRGYRMFGELSGLPRRPRAPLHGQGSGAGTDEPSGRGRFPDARPMSAARRRTGEGASCRAQVPATCSRAAGCRIRTAWASTSWISWSLPSRPRVRLTVSTVRPR